MLRGQCQSYPFFSSGSRLSVIRPQKLFLIIIAHRLLNIAQTDAQMLQLLAIILQAPLHRSSPTDINLINTGNLCQLRLDVFLCILLDQDRSRRCIQSK